VSGVQRPPRECLAAGCYEPRTDAKHCKRHAAERIDQLHQQHAATRHERYGQQWANLRRRIITRDGGACVACGSARRLQVHHIDGTARDTSNLVTLCNRCHAAAYSERVVRKVEAWMRLIGERDG
jgi:5-methylcytosine-specific restriction endonuclease McrA